MKRIAQRVWRRLLFFVHKGATYVYAVVVTPKTMLWRWPKAVITGTDEAVEALVRYTTEGHRIKEVRLTIEVEAIEKTSSVEEPTPFVAAVERQEGEHEGSDA